MDSPFVVPPLGRHYKEQWADEDLRLAPSDDSNSLLAFQEYAQLEDGVYPGRAVHGPLSTRLMASFIEEPIEPTQLSGNASDNEDEEREKKDKVKWRSPLDMQYVEDLLNNELSTLGLLEEMVIEL